MFDTWVINLDKDIQNFNILKEKLSDKEIEPKDIVQSMVK